MSEQSKIIEELHALIMVILKNGSATTEEGQAIDDLEDLLYQQKCYIEIKGSPHSCQGEEIASLFFNNSFTEAINKMCTYQITPEDFFGFTDYHYDEDEEEGEQVTMFTDSFISKATQAYNLQTKSINS